MDFEDNHIGNDIVRRFVAALRHFEQQGDSDDLVALFADDAELYRLDGRGARQDVRGFWSEYRAQFGEVRTQFRNTVEDAHGTEAGLEWHSSGTLAGGDEFDYAGSTFLTIADGRITGLRTYYDTAAFVTAPAGRA
jgi:ketosteroid isomerase-like protein